jgi:hypothetical protein
MAKKDKRKKGTKKFKTYLANLSNADTIIRSVIRARDKAEARELIAHTYIHKDNPDRRKRFVITYLKRLSRMSIEDPGIIMQSSEIKVARQDTPIGG